MSDNLQYKLLSILLGVPENPKVEELKKALANALLELEQPRAEASLSASEKSGRLEKAYKAFNDHHDFRPGQLVKWKKGLKTRLYPQYDEPAIVVAILEQPYIDSKIDSSTPHFNDHLNIQLGLVMPDGQFYCYLFDSRRFEPFRD